MKYLLSLTLALSLLSCGAQNQGATNGKYTDVSNAQAKELMSNVADLQIIDVRTDGEVSQGIIEGAVQYDISKPSFEKDLEKLDKSKPVLVYCAAGGRSKTAQNIMKEKGFTEVHNLSGGYSHWK